MSGKGGTGKTTVTAALAQLASEDPATRAILVDADVDAANLELLLDPRVIEARNCIGAQVASIDVELCAGCGRCAEVCRFDAIRQDDDGYSVDRLACEGCATCQTQCPEQAIVMRPHISGRCFFSASRYGPLFHARLYPAQENSGKLVTLLKQQAATKAQHEDFPLLIVDGQPGIGCPAISTIAGADAAIVVTEPTTAGMHDMERVIDLVFHFGIRPMVCINKADLYSAGTDRIIAFCQEKDLTVIGQLPFDTNVVSAMVQGQTITAYLPDSPISQALRALWQQIKAHIQAHEVL